MTRNEQIGSSIFVIGGGGTGLAYSLIKYAEPKNIASLSLDPYTLPAVVFGGMVFLGILRLIGGMKMPKTDEKGTALQIPKKTWITAILVLLYALLLKPVGFVITSFVYLLCQMYVLQDEKKNWKIMGIISAICSLGIYLLFSKVFSVLLPRGVLTII